MSPLTLLSICFVAGIGLGIVFPVPVHFGVFSLCVGVVLVAVTLRIRHRVALCLMTFTLVSGWIRSPPKTPSTSMEGAPCERVIEGRITQPPMTQGEGRRMVMEITRATGCLTEPKLTKLNPKSGTLVLSIAEGAASELNRGDRVRLRADIRPLLYPENPGTPHAASNRAYFSATVRNDTCILKTATSVFDPRHMFDRHRAALGMLLETGRDNDTAALAKAFVLGDTASLSFKTKNVFRRTGCAHLLAVSGLHLGLVAALSFLLVSRILLRTPIAARMDTGRIAACFALVATVAFTLLTGCRTPVVRACVMASAALAARAIGRPQAGIEAFFVAAAAILCVTPDALLDAGFQLSFSATAAFFFVFSHRDSPPDNDGAGNERFTKLRRSLSRFLRAALAAAAATTPIALYHFGYVSWIAPLSNLVAVPLTEFAIMPLLLTTLVVGTFLPALAPWILKPAFIAIGLLDGLLARIAALPCTVDSPAPAASLLIVLFCGIVLWTVTYGRRPRTVFIVSGLLTVIAAAVALLRTDPFVPGRLTVHFFDVGQGDSALITSPKGRHLLLDGGPVSRSGADAGERIIVPALRALGVDKIDIVAATHPDADHIGGLASTIDAFPVRHLFENGQGNIGDDTPVYRNLLSTATRRQVLRHRTPTICGPHPFDGATVTILHPCDWKEGFDPSASTNDNSLVLLVRYKKISLLLLGDVGDAVESMLVERGSVRSIDIIKSSHHGSKTATSPALLDTARPAYEVISVGRYNHFGMPHREVLFKLVEREIRILRTDRSGAIRISTDGEIIEIAARRADGSATIRTPRK